MEQGICPPAIVTRPRTLLRYTAPIALSTSTSTRPRPDAGAFETAHKAQFGFTRQAPTSSSRR
jgi:hypothetical protein